MPTPTSGYVKNMIRRYLREIIDPSPSKGDKKRIWEFFKNECAYCGVPLNKSNKDAFSGPKWATLPEQTGPGVRTKLGHLNGAKRATN